MHPINDKEFCTCFFAQHSDWAIVFFVQFFELLNITMNNRHLDVRIWVMKVWTAILCDTAKLNLVNDLNNVFQNVFRFALKHFQTKVLDLADFESEKDWQLQKAAFTSAHRAFTCQLFILRPRMCISMIGQFTDTILKQSPASKSMF